ncbi:MAG: aminotransferase class I/II-fold pyridoxal phosphate-dependent enzyme [Cyclobacteriaceae bacterium]|nr:aminotransferase class I/II-fold pyridoxal phosphate-dependent enzyme [Cyclobacteriaceae bacterium]
MLNLISRLPDVGTSIFTVMSRMALEQGAINLSQGFPDFPVSEEIVELIYKYLKEGHNQYAPMPGTPALRKAIADVVSTTYQRTTDFETEITITAGGTEALFSTIAALVQQGDEVIVFDPAYDSYDPSIRLNGGVPIHIALRPPHFAIDWLQVKATITPRTRLIIVNTPHNPTGSILREADLKQLEAIAQAHNIIVLSDEVYERIIFDNTSHESVLKYPGLAQHSVAIFSFGKTFHATGWKVGYAVAPPHLTQEIRKTHQFITFSVNTPVQLALAEYLATPDHYLQLGQFYQRKRDYFLNAIKGTSLKPLPCYGSYFQLLSYAGVKTLPEKEMAQWMTEELKLAPIPVSAFYQNGDNQQLLRFCFAKNEATLEKAGEILRKL